jgi:DNA-binding transcriptional regulator PaaX
MFGDTFSFPMSEDFFLSPRGMRKMSRDLAMGDSQYFSVLQSLKRAGCLRRVGDKYLIMPKGLTKAKVLKIERSDWRKKSWDGKWKIVIFDIPEAKRRERNIFRSFLKRKGFVRLQNSVFVSPYANFEELDFIRKEYKIEKYVNLLVSKSASVDDDSLLRKHFKL